MSENFMTSYHKLYAPQDIAGVSIDLTRLDRIRLHLRCLIHDHKYGWHLAGMRRELCLR